MTQAPSDSHTQAFFTTCCLHWNSDSGYMRWDFCNSIKCKHLWVYEIFVVQRALFSLSLAFLIVYWTSCPQTHNNTSLQPLIRKPGRKRCFGMKRFFWLLKGKTAPIQSILYQPSWKPGAKRMTSYAEATESTNCLTSTWVRFCCWVNFWFSELFGFWKRGWRTVDFYYSRHTSGLK